MKNQINVGLFASILCLGGSMANAQGVPGAVAVKCVGTIQSQISQINNKGFMILTAARKGVTIHYSVKTAKNACAVTIGKNYKEPQELSASSILSINSKTVIQLDKTPGKEHYGVVVKCQFPTGGTVQDLNQVLAKILSVDCE